MKDRVSHILNKGMSESSVQSISNRVSDELFNNYGKEEVQRLSSMGLAAIEPKADDMIDSLPSSDSPDEIKLQVNEIVNSLSSTFGYYDNTGIADEIDMLFNKDISSKIREYAYDVYVIACNDAGAAPLGQDEFEGYAIDIPVYNRVTSEAAHSARYQFLQRVVRELQVHWESVGVQSIHSYILGRLNARFDQ